MIRLALILLLFAGLAGCGFSPMYGAQSSGAAQPALAVRLADIAIAPGEDDLSRDLGDRLARSIASDGGGGLYALRLEAEENREGFAFRDDRAETRERIQIRVDMTLIDETTGRVLLTERMSGGSSYDLVQSDFANVATRRDARDRAAEHLAERITARLARHFSSAAGSD